MEKITRRTIMKAAVLAGVPAGAVSSISSDPLLDAINAYRAGKKAFLDVPDSAFTGSEAEDEIVEATYGVAQNLILRNTPETTSLTGVREAIRLAFEEDGFIDRIAENALRSALAYLDQTT